MDRDRSGSERCLTEGVRGCDIVHTGQDGQDGQELSDKGGRTAGARSGWQEHYGATPRRQPQLQRCTRGSRMLLVTVIGVVLLLQVDSSMDGRLVYLRPGWMMAKRGRCSPAAGSLSLRRRCSCSCSAYSQSSPWRPPPPTPSSAKAH